MKLDSPSPNPVRQLATFVVGQQGYALDIMRIKEIIQPVTITRVPGAPGFMEGVIELRGVILPVVDLRKRFELPATPPTRASKYVLVTLDDRIVALVVDGVAEFVKKGPDDIRPTPSLLPGAGGEARFFTGVFNHQGKILMVLDIDKILSSAERISLAGLGDSP
jgi:purine-binding chemotaxis protein CheW